MRLSLLSVPVLLMALAACGPSPASPGSLGSSVATGSGLTGLIGQSAASQTDQEIAQLLQRPNGLTFPVRLGIVRLDYQDPLKPEDEQRLFDEISKDLVATGLVRGLTQIPTSLIRSGDSVDAIRKTAATFQSDLALVISGKNMVQKADSQPLGFFEQFTSKSYYESRTTLSGLGLGVYSGIFLTPFDVAGKEGPALLDPADPSFPAQTYQLRLKAHSAALLALKDQFKASLQLLAANTASQAPASPIPASPTPTDASPEPSASPSDSPSPSSSPSAAPSESPSPSPSPSAT